MFGVRGATKFPVRLVVQGAYACWTPLSFSCCSASMARPGSSSVAAGRFINSNFLIADLLALPLFDLHVLWLTTHEEEARVMGVGDEDASLSLQAVCTDRGRITMPRAGLKMPARAQRAVWGLVRRALGPLAGG
jgi:hypothetical protein